MLIKWYGYILFYLEGKYLKVALIGLVNIMFFDEGLGTYLIKYIEANYEIPSNLEIVDGGLMGFSLMSYFQEFDKVLIVGTTSKKGSPGDIFRYSAQEMLHLGKTRQSANEVEVAMMIEICSFKEDIADIEFLTMLPENIKEVKNGLSNIILQNMPKLLTKTIEILKEYGVILKQTNNFSFLDIIAQTAMPTNFRL